MRKILWKTALLAVLFVSLAFLVPSAVPRAGAEEVPVYDQESVRLAEGTSIPYDVLAPTPDSNAFLADEGGYHDDSLDIHVETFRAYDTNCWAAWVTVADASQIRTELCKPYPSKSTAWAEHISRRVKAVLAINGDYFIDRREGFIVRNGEVLRRTYYDGYDALVIDDEGDFHILVNPTEESFAPYEGHIAQAFAFGPGIVIDGERITEYPSRMMAPQKKTQRICLCQMDHLKYLIIATEGPEQRNCKGLTMLEFSELVSRFSPQNAYNLDGGSSTWLVLDHQKLNARTKKRTIADILYFVTTVPEVTEAVEEEAP